MSLGLYDHQKVLVAESILGNSLYADFYKARNLTGPSGRLIIYFGGANSTETYIKRRETPPEPVFHEFNKGLIQAAVLPVDLLVVPAPPLDLEKNYYEDLGEAARNMGMPASESEGKRIRLFREDIQTFVFQEILPQFNHNPYDEIGLVGYSFGGYAAACLAFDLENARALAIIAGVGMSQAFLAHPVKSFAEKQIFCYANQEDPLMESTLEFVKTLKEHGRKIEPIMRAGGHPFADYAENDSVAQAFESLCKILAISS